ncbi:MAG: hypothetical protein Q8Q37_00355 [bacterium]|nr:hypothetical protein [bacterium]
MNKRMRVLFLIALMVMVVIIISDNIVLAQSSNVQDVGDVVRVLDNIVNWLFAFLLASALIFILIAAYAYLSAGGDQEEIKKAHRMIFYAAIAIAVGLLSRSVVPIVGSIFDDGVETDYYYEESINSPFGPA